MAQMTSQRLMSLCPCGKSGSFGATCMPARAALAGLSDRAAWAFLRLAAIQASMHPGCPRTSRCSRPCSDRHVATDAVGRAGERIPVEDLDQQPAVTVLVVAQVGVGADRAVERSPGTPGQQVVGIAGAVAVGSARVATGVAGSVLGILNAVGAAGLDAQRGTPAGVDAAVGIDPDRAAFLGACVGAGVVARQAGGGAADRGDGRGAGIEAGLDVAIVLTRVVSPLTVRSGTCIGRRRGVTACITVAATSGGQHAQDEQGDQRFLHALCSASGKTREYAQQSTHHSPMKACDEAGKPRHLHRMAVAV